MLKGSPVFGFSLGWGSVTEFLQCHPEKHISESLNRSCLPCLFCLLCKWASALETSTFQTQSKSKFTTAVSQTLTKKKKKEFLLILGVAWLSPWTFWLKHPQQPLNWPQASWTHLQRATWLRYFIPHSFSWEMVPLSPPPPFIPAPHTYTPPPRNSWSSWEQNHSDCHVGHSIVFQAVSRHGFPTHPELIHLYPILEPLLS